MSSVDRKPISAKQFSSVKSGDPCLGTGVLLVDGANVNAEEDDCSSFVWEIQCEHVLMLLSQSSPKSSSSSNSSTYGSIVPYGKSLWGCS